MGAEVERRGAEGEKVEDQRELEKDASQKGRRRKTHLVIDQLTNVTPTSMLTD